MKESTCALNKPHACKGEWDPLWDPLSKMVILESKLNSRPVNTNCPDLSAPELEHSPLFFERKAGAPELYGHLKLTLYKLEGLKQLKRTVAAEALTLLHSIIRCLRRCVGNNKLDPLSAKHGKFTGCVQAGESFGYILAQCCVCGKPISPIATHATKIQDFFDTLGCPFGLLDVATLPTPKSARRGSETTGTTTGASALRLACLSLRPSAMARRLPACTPLATLPWMRLALKTVVPLSPP